MKAHAHIWGATRCISSEQKLFETEPSERSQTHNQTPQDFPDKQIKHSDWAKTVIFIEFRISMAKAAFNDDDDKKKTEEEEKKKKNFLPANWTYL